MGSFKVKKQTKKTPCLLQQMVAKLQSQYRSGKDSRGDVRRGIGDGHTREREEISIWNPFSKSRNIDKY